MKFKKTDYLAILILAVVLVQLVIVYPSLPAQVVTNWGLDGQVTYGDKSSVWMLYGMNALMFPLFFIMPKIDPKGRNYAKVDGFYSAFRLVIVVFLAGVLELVIFSAEDAHRFNVGKIGTIAVALLLIFIGNYLPKCRQSYTLGIKTMWALADERVWNDTHRFGGVVFVVAGVIILAAALFAGEKVMMWAIMAAVLTAVVSTTVYSYLSYVKYNGGKGE